MRVQKTFFISLLVITIAGFILGLTTHVFTYFEIDPRSKFQIPWYALQLSSTLAFITGLMFYYRKKIAVPSTDTMFDTIWIGCFGIFSVYAIFNFIFASAVLNQDASPAIIDGRYMRISS